jgi:P-type conjugative transfer protein TrbL
MDVMKPTLLKHKSLFSAITVLLVALVAESAFAQAKNSNIYENVLDRYHTATHEWAAIILSHATWLFWTLALISMVWTFGMMALRKADIGEFFAEFIRFIIFTGLFWWLLLNGPRFGETIIASLRQIGGEATRLGPNLRPSAVVDIGFDIFFNALEHSTILSPLASLLTVFLGFIVLSLLALVAVNMLILLISGWVLLYGGVFFLGFGGARWTSDLAINYYKTVLGVAASLFAMVLIVGVATSIIEQYYRAMTPDSHVKELAVVVIVAFTMAMLVRSIPPLISGIITGASINQAGSIGFGAGAIVSAASMAAAAVATGSAAIAAGASNMAGGTQALMAAYRKGSMSGGGGDTLADGMTFSTSGSTFHSGSMNNDSSLAAAMGDYSSTSRASNFTQSSSAQDTTSIGAEKWNNKEPSAASRNAADRDRSQQRSGAPGHAGQTGQESDTADSFDKNYLAGGNAEFKFMAPEVRDFVNRSRPPS